MEKYVLAELLNQKNQKIRISFSNTSKHPSTAFPSRNMYQPPQYINKNRHH